MTAQEKVKYIFQKYKETKFSRSDFWWKYFVEFHEVGDYMTQEQWGRAYKDFQAVDRALRYVLREPEYRLPPEADKSRYEKAGQFQEENKPQLSKEEQWRKFSEQSL